MSESRAKLEQILELLLSEDNEKAEEMLHEYVVAKARSEYERVLEAEDEEVEESEEAVEESETVDEVVDKSNDFEDDILADEEEIENDESGLEEAGEEGEEAGEEGEEDLEDKVDDLEAELEDLRAEFEKLMGGEEGDDEMDMDMGDAEGGDMEVDMGGEEGDDEMMDSVEYDLDEEVEDGEVVEEATKLQNSVAAPKAPVADASNGTSPVAKHKAGWETGAPVKAKDGGAGNSGANKPKNHTPTSNIGIKPAKVNAPKA
jgi:exosome complex component RRP41